MLFTLKKINAPSTNVTPINKDTTLKGRLTVRRINEPLITIYNLWQDSFTDGLNFWKISKSPLMNKQLPKCPSQVISTEAACVAIATQMYL